MSLFLLPLLLGGPVFVRADATGANDGTSWTDAFTDLQSALANPLPGAQEIWIAAGTYRPSKTGDRMASFQIGNRTIYGGFDGTESTLDERAGLFDRTILDGDLLGNDEPPVNLYDNSYHVLVADAASTTTIDGLTIRGGHAAAPGNESSGGGLWVQAFSEFDARDCRFVDNSAALHGGGAFLDIAQSTFTRCIFLGNASGDEGGGVYCIPVEFGNAFDRCRFLGNRSATGGAAGGQSGTFRGCVFSGNQAHSGLGGGAIQARFGLFVVNCTFATNDATSSQIGGGAILYTGYTGVVPPVWNSIFSGNFDSRGEDFTSQIRVGPQADYVELRACCVPGFDPTGRGARNLMADPEFVAPLGRDGIAGTEDDDLRLSTVSPCIDRGNDAFAGYLAPVDLAGRTRLVDALECGDGGVLDIGAFEHQLVLGTTNHCPGAPSSLGVPAVIVGPCAPSLDAGPLDLAASPVPPGGGVFLFGPDRARTPFGDGFLCVGGAVRRTRPVRSGAGTLATSIDLDDPAVASVLLPGTCWSFQALFRDSASAGAGFNLSDAIRVTFR